VYCLPEAFVKADNFVSLICGGAVLVALFASVNAVRARGHINFRQPATILSASGTGPQTAERFLQFLAEANRRMPPGSSITLLWAGHRTIDDDKNCWFTSVGQLPEHRVLFAATSLDPRDQSAERPEFVGSFGGAWSHPDFDLVGAFNGGFLYQARH
jgi:hypothetical protein